MEATRGRGAYTRSSSSSSAGQPPRVYASGGGGFAPQTPSYRLSAGPVSALFAASSSSATTSSAVGSSASSIHNATYPPFPLGWPSLLAVGSTGGGVPLLASSSSSMPQPTAAFAGAPWSTQMAAGVTHMGGVGALLPPQPFGAIGAQALGQPQQQQQQRQQQRVLQVVARLPGLGTVSVCVEAGSRVQDLIMSIETQVWGAFGVPVEVRKLSDLHNIDLAPSYEVGKLLDDEDDHPILAFVEPPPTKVLQNKEFSFTVAFAFPAGTTEEAEQAWRGPGAGKMLKVTVACEAGEAVPDQNFSVRTMVMEGKDMIGVFGRLRVNSYYGRKRYLIRVFCGDAAGWRSNVLVSDPITVLSKKCKHRTKRSKEGDADADADADAAEVDAEAEAEQSS